MNPETALPERCSFRRQARHRYVPAKRSTTWRFSMKRIVIDSMPDLFQRVRLRPTQCEFISGRPSAGNADHCGCIVTALYLNAHPLVTMEDLLMPSSTGSRTDQEGRTRTNPAHPPVRRGADSDGLRGRVSGWSDCSVRWPITTVRFSYFARSTRRDNQGSGIRGRHDRW